MTFIELHKTYKGKNIDYNQAEYLLYLENRDRRFELFITLYDATLKKDLILAYKVFREAYSTSDNIYKQIENSSVCFNLKSFLNLLKSNNIDFYNLMREDEKVYYDELPQTLNIFRGMSEQEHKSNNIGISWSLSKEEAEKYIYYKKNNAEKGGLVSKQISKKEILTVFSVFGDKEIIYIE